MDQTGESASSRRRLQLGGFHAWHEITGPSQFLAGRRGVPQNGTLAPLELNGAPSRHQKGFPRAGIPCSNSRAMSTDAQLTPMMAQYRRIKAELPKDALLLFRLGDFYELFFDDATVGAPLLNVALTKRNG